MYNRNLMPLLQPPVFPMMQQNPMTMIPQMQVVPMPQQQGESKGLFDGLGAGNLGSTLGLMAMMKGANNGIDQNAPGIRNTLMADPMDPMSQFLPMDEQILAAGGGGGLSGVLPWLRGLFG